MSLDDIPPVPKPGERDALQEQPVGPRNREVFALPPLDDPPSQTGLTKTGVKYRFFSGSVTPAGAVPTAAEMIAAVEAAYAAAEATPVEGDVVFIGTTFAYHISASSTLAVTVFRFAFTVGEDTWYAFGFQTALF